MASEESKLINQEPTNDNPVTKEPESSQPATPAAATPAAATKDDPPMVVSDSDDDDEPRPSGDVDFGQLLDQFEQEQASLQEGEVVRGIVVGISERGVVI